LAAARTVLVRRACSNQSAVVLRSGAPAETTSTIAAPSSCGATEAATRPLTPSSISST
jgi:hypothetical protein